MSFRLYTLAHLAVVTALLGIAAPRAAAQDDIDAAALQDVQKFLNDPAARQQAAGKNAQAGQAEAFYGKFPPYAQKELNEIVMMIMTESKGGAMKHVDAHKQGGPQAAYESFSPAVKARVQSLEARLAKDPKFNTPQNLQMLHGFMPAFLGRPAG